MMSYDDYTTDNLYLKGQKYIVCILINNSEAFIAFKGTMYQKARYLNFVMMMYVDMDITKNVVFKYDLKRDAGAFRCPKQS